ncbi:MAG: TATA-box-binding protein [Promethearchaeota archaeon]
MQIIDHPNHSTVNLGPIHTPVSNKLSKISLRIENVVASVNLHTYIEIPALLEKYKDIEKKSNFPGVIVKLKQPKATILLFSSGKIVVTGVKMPKYIPIVVEKTIHKLQDAGIEILGDPEIKIQNIVCRADFGTKINLDKTALSLNSSVYEPEVFPGLIYKIKSPNSICFLVFNSGKVICTGAKHLSVIKKATKELGKALKKFDVLGGNPSEIHQTLDLNLDDLL